MKNLIFGFIATVIFGFAGNSQVQNDLKLLEFTASVAISTYNPKVINVNEVALTHKLFSFDNYKLNNYYIINGVTYEDTGKNYDNKIGDGIYTANQITLTKTLIKDKKNGFILNDNFRHKAELKSFILNDPNLQNIVFGCSVWRCPCTQGQYDPFGWGCVCYGNCYVEISVF
jgi:hypothetical protein